MIKNMHFVKSVKIKVKADDRSDKKAEMRLRSGKSLKMQDLIYIP